MPHSGQIAERGSDGKVVRRSARDEQPHHVVVDRWLPIAPDSEVDRLQVVWVQRVYVRALVEQKSHHLTTGGLGMTRPRRSRFDVPFARRKMHSRRVPVSGSSKT